MQTIINFFIVIGVLCCLIQWGLSIWWLWKYREYPRSFIKHDVIALPLMIGFIIISMAN